jgi:iron complex outermembrane receptor protein
LVRRSGVANDIILRGQKKDNINVTIDGAKIYGACPNRMDPPISHILTNNVDYIEINEGPFNVEDFGSLSGDVKIHTLKPSKELTGEIDLGAGSWGYQKGAFSLSGGTDKVRVLVSGSREKSGQYEDGDGNDFIGQMTANNIATASTYKDAYSDMDAYEKNTFMSKVFFTLTDDQELRFGYTANRSDNVLYPSTKMDAIYDDSNIYTMEYIHKNIGKYSKELNLELYQSDVDHPMSNMYRNTMEMTNALKTKMQGAKLKNSFDVDNHTITTGVDYSKRTWDGDKYSNNAFFTGGDPLTELILDAAETKNTGLFVKDNIISGKYETELAVRYDHTKASDDSTAHQDNTYKELTGYIFETYHADESTDYFAGLGKSSRVPDLRELYYGTSTGNHDLKNTLNYEFDMGVEKKYENATVKAKGFYSKLKDFIFYNGSTFENEDAKLYGVELSGTYMATNSLYYDYGMTYQRGKKDAPLSGQSGTDMPEIPPFKLNAGVNYDYDASLALRAEVVASAAWTHFDFDNGEQSLNGYTVTNLKGTKTFGKHFEFTLGVDNVFDKTYAVSNTYSDLTLLTGTGEQDVMLLNEPGRYFYTNLKYKF